MPRLGPAIRSGVQEMNLTESQRRAIEHVGRNLQLIACAGSGKTEVVARRECQRDGLVNEVVQGALKLILEPIFDGSPDPTTQGWQNTIGRMATQIQEAECRSYVE